MWVPMYMCESAYWVPTGSRGSVSVSVPTGGRGSGYPECVRVSATGGRGRAMGGYMIWRSYSGLCESSKYSAVLSIIPAVSLSVHMCKVCLTMVAVKNRCTETLEHGTWVCCPRYGRREVWAPFPAVCQSKVALSLQRWVHSLKWSLEMVPAICHKIWFLSQKSYESVLYHYVSLIYFELTRLAY